MKNLHFQKKDLNMDIIQKKINIINKELIIRKPHLSIKTLFNGKNPQNRKNLKKNEIRIPIIKPKKEIKRSAHPPIIIESIINDSKNLEFLSPDSYNNLNFLSSSSIYTVNSPKNYIPNGVNNTLKYKYLNSTDSFGINKIKNQSQLSTYDDKEGDKTAESKTASKDLNQLYQKYINDVSL